MQYNLAVMSPRSTFHLILSSQLIFSVQLDGKTPLETVAAPTDWDGVAPSSAGSAPQTRPSRCPCGAGSCTEKLLPAQLCSNSKDVFMQP